MSTAPSTPASIPSLLSNFQTNSLHLEQIINYCCAEGTRVTLANQTSVPIETISSTQPTSILSYDQAAGGCINKHTQPPHRVDQGVKQCVELVLEDGRVLMCTADHQVRTTRGDVRVDQLTAVDRVLVSPEGPLVDGVGAEDWTLTLKFEQYGVTTTVVCRTTDPVGYSRAMAFARLLGYVITDGCLMTNAGQLRSGRLYMGHLLDAQSIALDIALVLGVHPTTINISPPTATQSTYNIDLPIRLARVLEEFGCPIGKKLGQGIGLPDIFLKTDTPIDFTREFLGALFGGDGSPPHLSDATSSWTQIRFHTSVKAADLDDARLIFEGELMALLNLYGVTGEVLDVEATSDIATPGTHQVVFAVSQATTLQFAESIGFRHCIHKQQRLCVAAGYYRGVDRRLDQQQRLITSAIALRATSTSFWQKAIDAAVAQMKTTEVVLSGDVIPKKGDMKRYVTGVSQAGNQGTALYKTIPCYINDCGASAFFNPGAAVTGSSARVYAVPRHLTALPTWDLGVEGIRPVGLKKTYDLCVADTHLFVANGIIAHNCEGSIHGGRDLPITLARTRQVRPASATSTAALPLPPQCPLTHPLTSPPPSSSVPQYVEDCLCSIAENIQQTSAELTTFLDAQAEVLADLTAVTAAVTTRLSSSSAFVAHARLAQLTAPLPLPPRLPRMAVIPDAELPSISRPKVRHRHGKLDLDTLSTIGVDNLPGEGISRSTRTSLSSAGRPPAPPHPAKSFTPPLYSLPTPAVEEVVRSPLVRQPSLSSVGVYNSSDNGVEAEEEEEGGDEEPGGGLTASGSSVSISSSTPPPPPHMRCRR